jgi:ATP-grasp domain
VTTTRKDLRRAVESALGRRRLIWSGIRGDDAESVSDVAQFQASFTLLNAYARRPLLESLAYEDTSGTRADMETWDIDDHPSADATLEFRHALLRAMSVPCALLPYRPSRFLSALTFARKDRCLNLGLFGSHQFAFEHKPWVESALDAAGVRTLDWHYIADEDQIDAERLLADGPVMVRRSRSSGGEGMVCVSEPEQLRSAWPRGAEAFASVARYVPEALPLNVGATVWPDGVTVHMPSVQLVGVDGCVGRPFGYCGNDFALAKQLTRRILDGIEDTTVAVGRWLREHGYLGTFGVDYLLDGDNLLFTEVNPRFQGSTRLSAWLSVELDLPCLPLEHMAAFLGLPRPDRPRLRDVVASMPERSQVVVHHLGPDAADLDVRSLHTAVRQADRSARLDVPLPPGVTCETHAVLGRFTLDGTVTTTGFDLRADLHKAITKAQGTIARSARGGR